MDCDDDAGGVGAGGGEVVVQGRQEHVATVFHPGDGGLADAEPPGDFDLGELGSLSDHGQVHGVDPVHLLGLGVGL
ncbi:MAG TPA: hypothetical protein VMI73_15915, partial [Trebonia sp.]|nr:hypothetical protein [Trebonia sp.]